PHAPRNPYGSRRVAAWKRDAHVGQEAVGAWERGSVEAWKRGSVGALERGSVGACAVVAESPPPTLTLLRSHSPTHSRLLRRRWPFLGRAMVAGPVHLQERIAGLHAHFHRTVLGKRLLQGQAGRRRHRAEMAKTLGRFGTDGRTRIGLNHIGQYRDDIGKRGR